MDAEQEPTESSGFPYKETLDYAKNLAFCSGICAFSLSTTHGRDNAAMAWVCFSAGMGLLTSMLMTFSTRAFLRSLPPKSKTVSRALEVFAFVFWLSTVFFVKWRLDH